MKIIRLLVILVIGLYLITLQPIEPATHYHYYYRLADDGNTFEGYIPYKEE